MRREAWRPGPPGRQFDDDRRRHPLWPLVLGEGDSWFSHPIQWNILWHLSARGGYAIRRIARSGDEMRAMVLETPGHRPQFVKQLSRPFPWRILLWSGGGNDLLGAPLTRILRQRSEVARGWRGLIRDSVVAAELARIRHYYQRVLFRTAQVRPGCQVVAHGYDHPYPRNKGVGLFWGHLPVVGPWIHPVMVEEKGITDPDTQHRIASELVDRFNDLLAELAAAHPQLHHVDLRGTLTSVAQWDDEIHPRSAGFKKMAARFRAVMDGLV